MKLLLVSVHFAPAWIEGGVTFSSWNLTRGLVRAGASVQIVTTNAYLGPDEQVPARRQESGVTIRTVPIAGALGSAAHRYGLAPGLARQLTRACAEADLCLLQGLWAAPVALGAAICRRRGLPYVLCAWGTLEEVSLAEKPFKKRLYMKLLLARVIRQAAAVHFVSESEHRNSRRALGATPGLVLPAGFDPVELRPRRGDTLRRRLGLPADSTILGLSGRVHPRKGFEVILPALARCPERVHLVSFGPDLERHHPGFAELAASLGVGERYHHLGYLEGDALQSIYASVDLLVLPSFGESFGNVVIDALQQQTPVMISDRVALADYVRQRRLGQVIESLEPRDWGDAIRRWVGSSPDFDGARAVEMVQRDFGLEACGRRALEALRDLAAGLNRPSLRR